MLLPLPTVVSVAQWPDRLGGFPPPSAQTLDIAKLPPGKIVALEECRLLKGDSRSLRNGTDLANGGLYEGRKKSGTCVFKIPLCPSYTLSHLSGFFNNSSFNIAFN